MRTERYNGTGQQGFMVSKDGMTMFLSDSDIFELYQMRTQNRDDEFAEETYGSMALAYRNLLKR